MAAAVRESVMSKVLFLDVDGDGVASAFWPKVKKQDGCWEWAAAAQNKGYGVMTVSRMHKLATHVSWWLHTGEWPEKFVLHKCDNPPCVRIDHLFLGDQKDNMRDAATKGRLGGIFQVKEVCKYGHPMKGDNIGIINSQTRGKQLRYCKACSRRDNIERKEYKHQWYTRNKVLTNE